MLRRPTSLCLTVYYKNETSDDQGPLWWFGQGRWKSREKQEQEQALKASPHATDVTRLHDKVNPEDVRENRASYEMTGHGMEAQARTEPM